MIRGGLAGGGWGNITGLTKSAKNIFAVGSLTTAGNKAGLEVLDLLGMDEFYLISVQRTGGTSHASLAGVFAQLIQAIVLITVVRHPVGLLKSILMNTADDIMNPGPIFGLATVKSMREKLIWCIEHGRFFKDSVMHNMFNAHFLVVPPNVKQMKAVYWTIMRQQLEFPLEL